MPNNSMLRSAILLCILSLSIFTPISAAQVSPKGTWLIIDDKTGEQKGIVNIWQQNGTLSGKIIEILSVPDKKNICSKCPGNFHNQPIEGLTFMWGLKYIGKNEWGHGHILDPNSGNIYRCKITVSADNQKLYVRGYIGISFLGRTQTWLRK